MINAKIYKAEDELNYDIGDNLNEIFRFNFQEI